jgi:hypothetical protein
MVIFVDLTRNKGAVITIPESFANERSVPGKRKSIQERIKSVRSTVFQQKDADEVDSGFRNVCYIEHLPKLSEKNN